MLRHQVLPLGSFGTNCIILWHEGSPECWIVDPGQEAQALIDYLAEKSLSPALVALTHAHFDHISALPGLLAQWPGLPVHISAAELPVLNSPLNAYAPEYPRVSPPATLAADLADGTILEAAGISARVMALPGHTPGSVGLHFESAKLLLSGDTLFAGSCGRTDLPGGNMRDMTLSLARLAALPPNTAVIPGHGRATTIANEVATNSFMVR